MVETGLSTIVSALLVVASTATSSGGSATAWVTAGTVEPGDPLNLVFSIQAPALVQVIAAERVGCTVTFPDGTQEAPCAYHGSLLEAHVLSDGRQEFIFRYTAPDGLGTYQVRFWVTTTLSLPTIQYEAQTTFRVVAPQAPPVEGGEDGPSLPPNGDDGGVAKEIARTLQDADTARMLTSILAGGGVFTLILLERRGILGGIP